MTKVEKMLKKIINLKIGQELEFETISKSNEIGKYLIEPSDHRFNIHKTYIYKKNMFHSFKLDVSFIELSEILQEFVFVKGIKLVEKKKSTKKKKKVKKNESTIRKQ
jgi:hypothetical protein